MPRRDPTTLDLHELVVELDRIIDALNHQYPVVRELPSTNVCNYPTGRFNDAVGHIKSIRDSALSIIHDQERTHT